MVIKFYKTCLLGVLLIAPIGVSADLGTTLYDGVQDVVTGPIGWGGHAGLGYLGYKGYKAYKGLTEDPAVKMLKIAGFEVASNNLMTTAGIALGTAALYHSALMYNFCTFGVELRKMKRPNTSSNPVFRNKWAGCDSAVDLMDELGQNGRGKDPLKKQLLLEMGLKENTPPLEGIKKIDAALDKLDKRLANYAWYTNIVELTAQAMIDEDADSKALLGGDVLINNDINGYSEDLLKSNASNSWMHNSVTIGWHLKENCYFKRPTLYTATYNMASHCAMKTLEQYGRLKAVRHILEQYVPATQRQPRVIVHQH